jgi:hypothetical protein
VQDYHKVLRRIAAILLALAALAERASRRSGPVRCLVLWILRAADAAARPVCILTESGFPTAGKSDSMR